MNLRVVPRPPSEEESYTIEAIDRHSSSSNGGAKALIRVIGTDQTFSMPLKELMDPSWFSKFSDENKKMIGCYYALNFVGNLKELEKFKPVDLFKYPIGLTLAALYIFLLLISNLLGGKLTMLLGYTFPSVLYFFPATFIIGDIITENYGYRVSRKVIQVGFLGNLLTLLAMFFVLSMPASPIWYHQEAFENAFVLSTRVSAASLCAYLFGEISNAALLSKLKILYNDRHLMMRVAVASGVADLLDSILFCFVAFLGVVPFSEISKMILVQFIFKFTYELLALPLTAKICRYIKKKELVDVYDHNINYNPLIIKE